ncbi:hypothetical protein ACLB2K_039217 [Fragaria x ananassa]
MGMVILLSSFLCVFLVLGLIRIIYKLWWVPTRIQKFMASQGIKGPCYRLIHGNTQEISSMHKETRSRSLGLSHDILSYVQPHVHSWTNIYGKTYLQWHGTRAQLVIQEPELCKQILNNKDRAYPKRESLYFVKKLLGDGLVTIVEHEKWAKLRRIATHAFHGESLKTMIPDMIASAETMLERWKIHEGKEIEVYEEFRLFTSEVIAKTAFGSSYVEGELVFQTLMKLAFLLFKNVLTVKVPGISKISKGSDELEAERLEKSIHDSITDIVKKREKKAMCNEEHSYGSDFLGLLLKAHHDANMSHRISVDDLVGDCKTFYFAGQETTNTLLSWTVLLLALHTDWQEEARKEVLQLFGKQNPNPDGISKLKTMNMIINETLRLYPPFVALVRKAEREVTLGKVIVPADLELVVSILSLHREPQLWGPDAHLFKPERFSEGVAKATNNNTGAFLPFGFGPRTCVGLNFATTEAKIALSMILQRYSFTLSPGKNYLQWLGPRAQLVIREPELCRQILNNKDGAYQKIPPENFVKKLLGYGLVTIAEGQKWSNLRKISSHAFHGESLKTMIPDIIACAEIMLKRWESHEGKEIDVVEEFRLFTSEVISRTAFGSSYLEGQHIFEMLKKLALILFRNSLQIKVPGVRKLFKTNDEIESEKLEKGIHDSIIELVKKREHKATSGEQDNFGSDFLGLLLKAHHNANLNQRISVDDIVDDCKTFYLAGQDTTSTLLTWTVFLLALDTDWQEEARKEVLQLFGKQNPNPDDISKLKTMSMILNESLRLYPPVLAIPRITGREVRLGKLIVPADVELLVSVLTLHHEPQFWGPDVHLFKPERFSEGVAKATNNNIGTFMPFGLGSRTCVGLNFATTEAKIALSMILQRYSFTLSPAYIHSPCQSLLLRPQHGLQVLLQPL